jgi:hypothetical protein
MRRFPRLLLALIAAISLACDVRADTFGPVAAPAIGYTPTVDCNSGSGYTVSGASFDYSYQPLDKRLVVTGTIQITTAATCANPRFTLPASYLPLVDQPCYGRESAATGKSIAGQAVAGQSTVLTNTGDGSALTSGWVFKITCVLFTQ